MADDCDGSHHSETRPHSRIGHFYAGRSVLITGATGFIGKVLLWKLLESCSSCDTIYVLVRRKRGASADDRLGRIMNLPIFDNFRERAEGTGDGDDDRGGGRRGRNVLDKIVAVAGSMEEEGLGISTADRAMLERNVSVVFHSAAALNMSQTLSSAVNANVAGTSRLLNLCEKMDKLTAFVFVSTAFCYWDKDVTKEKVYAANYSPFEVMRLLRCLDAPSAAKITPRLIEPHPTTYTYSKVLTENLVREFFPKLPVVVVRPGVVIASHRDPFAGWIDSFAGTMGVLAGGWQGLLRTILIDGRSTAYVISVDVVVNCLIAAAWNVSEEFARLKRMPVYNVVPDGACRISWNEFYRMWEQSSKKFPLASSFWYPKLNFHSTRMVHTIFKIIFQRIPSRIGDLVLVLIGKPSGCARIGKKLELLSDQLSPFLTHSWKFSTVGVETLRDRMNAADRETFNVVQPNLRDRREYFENFCYFSREFLMNERPSTLRTAIFRLKAYVKL